MSTTSLVLALAILIPACSAHHRGPAGVAVANARVGDCADPERAGVIGRAPDLRRADRDLDGDGQDEHIVADRSMCSGENCYWNVFGSDRSAGCRRYLGTVSGLALDRLERSGQDGYRDLRGWWRLASDDRYLIQHYEYRRGGYRLVEAMVCRQEGDDRLLCASEAVP